MKKLFAFIAATCLSATVLLCGCSFPFSGTNGRDGKDGKNASAYDYYELAKTIPGNENMTVEEFLEKYLNYTSDELEEAFGLQASINRSLKSAVSIAAQFNSSSTSLGSGVIVDLNKDSGDAYVITNCHVIYNDSSFGSYYPKNVFLYLYGQDIDYNDEDNRFDATVVGASITYDIALLKVTGSELLKKSAAEAAIFAPEEDIYLGEDVYAIGNAEGYGMSATRGIVTKDRETIPLNISSRYQGRGDHTLYYNVIRTDAAINEGNSGGALFNRKGEIVAIVNSKTDEDGVDGMSYAIPASAVKRLYPLLRENGSVNVKPNRAHFVVEDDFTKAEVGGELVSSAITNQYQVKVKGSASTWDSENNRLVINEKVIVCKDCYGLKKNDEIRHIKITDGATVVADMDVSRLYHLNDTLLAARQGYSVVITVKRGEETVDVAAQMTFSSFD